MNATIPVSAGGGLWLGLAVSKWDRQHLTVGADAVTVAGPAYAALREHSHRTRQRSSHRRLCRHARAGASTKE
jgi:hypothetical protein